VRYGADVDPCTYSERAAGGDAPDGGTKRARKTGARKAAAKAAKAAPAAPRYTRQATDKTCPRCGAAKLGVLTPTDPSGGAPFYACEDRACKFRLPVGAKRRRLPCPTCGGVVLERWVKPNDPAAVAEAVWRCARYPQCRFSAAWTAA
jgi:predicted RNA-binding Zn-ribbon protein involved in translation (DUF1610 family)